MAHVSIRALNKKYDNGFHAVKDVNLEIRDKEFLVLVGPSGCGKTTTLRMVAGLEEITSGEIRVGDEVVNDLPPMDRDIAMVFQNYALYPHKTVFDNMAFGLQMRGYKKEEIRQRVQEAAEILGIQALLERKPRQLSGGQRQRVAVGRAIVRHPQVFLFDEPLSNLDAKLRVQMRVELKRLHERLETTAIYVTHDQVEAMTLGTRVVVMKDGRVQQMGEPLELYGRPANKFVAGFIGSPAMNFVDVTISSDGLWAEAQGLRLQVPQRMRSLGGRRLTLGMRPEALRLANGSTEGADAHGFTTTVDVLEPLGNEILLNFRAGGVPMVARVDPGVRVKAHESIRLALDPERLHFFDAGSEDAL
jgi:multiple sugar transport system ATP-binding protein